MAKQWISVPILTTPDSLGLILLEGHPKNMIVDGLSSSGILKDTILYLFQDQSYLSIK